MKRGQVSITILLRLLFFASVVMASWRFLRFPYAIAVASAAMTRVYAIILLARWLARRFSGTI